MYPKLILPGQKTTLLLTKIIVLLLMFFSATAVSAQKITLQGTVKDEKDNPVIFASVFVKGTSSATSTDLSGKFNMLLSVGPVTLIFSSVGYITTEVKVAVKELKDSVNKINFTMHSSSEELESVSVRSLGSVRQKPALGYDRVADDYVSPGLTAKLSGVSVTATDRKTSSRRKDVAMDKTMLSERTPLAAIPKEKTKGYKAESATATRSRLLTAGELNDFKKWRMWEDYNKMDFKAYSEKWKLFATERYCVQLQNRDKIAIVGEKLFLISKVSGDTLWTAMSDNTGKAELWKGLSKKTADDNLVIGVGKESKQFPAIPFSQGINGIVVNRNCAVSNRVEVAFLVDATGSMQDEINYLKEELEDVLTKVTVKDPGIDLHTAAVFYRDNGDAYLTKVRDFSKGVSNTTSFIKEQDAGGGGDYPEAVNDGLNAAINELQWTAAARTRIIFLLMDAPPHDEAKEQMKALILQAANKGIRIVPVACSGTDKATEFIMRSIALATNGSYLFLTDDSGIGNAHIKPTTDEIKVELLNDLLQRIIEQMCFVNTCDEHKAGKEPVVNYENTENINIFPNPTPGPVTLLSKKKLKEIWVADFTGKFLMRIPLNYKAKYQFNLRAFPAGTYLVKYITDENKTGTEKVVLIK